MIFGYARVSTQQQSLDEQIELHRLLSQEQQLARTEQAKRLELESVNTRLIETNTDVLNEKDVEYRN